MVFTDITCHWIIYVSLRSSRYVSLKLFQNIYQVIHLHHNVTKKFSGVSCQQPQVLQVTSQVHLVSTLRFLKAFISAESTSITQSLSSSSVLMDCLAGVYRMVWIGSITSRVSQWRKQMLTVCDVNIFFPFWPMHSKTIASCFSLNVLPESEKKL